MTPSSFYQTLRSGLINYSLISLKHKSNAVFDFTYYTFYNKTSQILDLSYCDLTDVSALAHLPSLVMLDLSHNKLHQLPPPCPSLTTLIFNNNRLADLQGLFIL